MAKSLSLVVLLCAAAAGVSAGAFNDDLPIGGAGEVRHNVDKGEANPRDESVIYGARESYDSLLYYEYVDIKASFLDSKTKTITFSPNNRTKITCITVLDRLQTGENAKVEISVENNIAKINMKGRQGKHVQYRVSIYGYEDI